LDFCCGLALAGLAAARLAGGSDFSFQGLGGLSDPIFSSAADVTGRGNQVVGYTNTSKGEIRPFLWSVSDGMRDLGFAGSAAGVSGDGSVVAGDFPSESHTEAFRWTLDGGRVGLGDLPGGEFFSLSSAVSNDGLSVVGVSRSSKGPEAFLWQGGTINGLGDLDGGEFNSAAGDVSEDGGVVVGAGVSSKGQEAFIWTNAGGMGRLSDFIGAGDFIEASGISPDARFIVGAGRTDNGIEAFLWSDDAGLIYLGTLGAGGSSYATDVAEDGTYVVGAATGGEAGGAFYWNADEGMVELKAKLVEQGVEDVADWYLEKATAVSADGRTIVGFGFNPDGRTEAWIATIPEPGAGALVLLSLVFLGAYRTR
jgi:probable HAF family extracellular repeat protein